jgi:CBS domain-containing protein
MATPGFDFSAPPFDLLDAAGRACVEAALDVGFFPPGTVLIEAGQPSAQVYVVLRGEVEAGDVDDGRERLFSDYGPGEVFGAFAVITGRARHRYRARSEVLAFLLPAATFRTLLERQPRFAAWFHEGLSAKRQLLAEKSAPSEANRLMLTRVRDAQRAEAVVVPPTTSIGAAVAALRRHGVECLIVHGSGATSASTATADDPGIVTRTDLLDALALEGHGLDSAVGPLAHRPLIGVREDDVLFQALVTMTESHIERVAVRRGAEVVGTIGLSEVLSHYASQSHLISLRLARAANEDDVVAAAREMDALVRTLFAQGAKISYLMEMVSALNSRLLAALFAFCVPEPLRGDACLLVLGSEGRREQILKTDQDNALILAPGVAPEAYAEATARFAARLADIGYPPCAGGVMASNAHWRQTLDGWQRRIADWRRRGDPVSLMELSMVVDARPVAGERRLVQPLHDDLMALGRDDILMRQMVLAAFQFDTPLTLFGRVRDGGDGTDIKKGGIFPLVHGLRTLALRHGVARSNSFARCEGLVAAGALSSELGRDVPQAMAVFQRLRLGQQLDALAAGRVPDNRLDVAALRHLDRELLRDALRVVNRFKDHLREAFQLRGVA